VQHGNSVLKSILLHLRPCPQFLAWLGWKMFNEFFKLAYCFCPGRVTAGNPSHPISKALLWFEFNHTFNQCTFSPIWVGNMCTFRCLQQGGKYGSGIISSLFYYLWRQSRECLSQPAHERVEIVFNHALFCRPTTRRIVCTLVPV